MSHNFGGKNRDFSISSKKMAEAQQTATKVAANYMGKVVDPMINRMTLAKQCKTLQKMIKIPTYGRDTVRKNVINGLEAEWRGIIKKNNKQGLETADEAILTPYRNEPECQKLLALLDLNDNHLVAILKSARESCVK